MAGKPYRNLEAVEQAIGMLLYDIILNDLKDELVDIWFEHQQELVYDQYEPEEYVRRYSSGGLADRDNIRELVAGSITKELQVFLDNVTTGADSHMNELINHLIEGTDGFAGDPATGMPARPYTQAAIEYVHSNPNRIKAVLQAGFAKRGVNVVIR